MVLYLFVVKFPVTPPSFYQKKSKQAHIYTSGWVCHIHKPVYCRQFALGETNRPRKNLVRCLLSNYQFCKTLNTHTDYNIQFETDYAGYQTTSINLFLSSLLLLPMCRSCILCFLSTAYSFRFKILIKRSFTINGIRGERRHGYLGAVFGVLLSAGTTPRILQRCLRGYTIRWSHATNTSASFSGFHYPLERHHEYLGAVFGALLSAGAMPRILGRCFRSSTIRWSDATHTGTLFLFLFFVFK